MALGTSQYNIIGEFQGQERLSLKKKVAIKRQSISEDTQGWHLVFTCINRYLPTYTPTQKNN